jgi:hypothetical protein
LSVILDILPLYIVFWYLRKTGKEKEEIYKRKSMKSMKSEKSVSSLNDINDTNQRTASKIVIEMVNLKS